MNFIPQWGLITIIMTARQMSTLRKFKKKTVIQGENNL